MFSSDNQSYSDHY